MAKLNFINQLISYLNKTAPLVDRWFNESDEIRVFHPANGGWNINQILEHISITSHYLLILIEKGTRKSLNKLTQADLDAELQNYTFHNPKLETIGKHLSFHWPRPDHMEPNGQKSLTEIRTSIKAQFNQCLGCLEKIPNGEGILHKTTMSVNDLGKIDVYQYIYFLGKHAERHIEQMEKVKLEYLESKYLGTI